MQFQQMKKVLKTKCVGIAGCGGLGSNCAISLARSGIGKLIIADYDKIEKENLNRQYFFYHQLGKNKVDALKENIRLVSHITQVETHQVFLDKNNIHLFAKDCDVIVEAFDRAKSKQMLAEYMISELPDTPLVLGLGIAGIHQIDQIKMKKYGNLYVCGDETSEVNEMCSPIAPKVIMVANLQANTVINILMNA